MNRLIMGKISTILVELTFEPWENWRFPFQRIILVDQIGMFYFNSTANRIPIPKLAFLYADLKPFLTLCYKTVISIVLVRQSFASIKKISKKKSKFFHIRMIDFFIQGLRWPMLWHLSSKNVKVESSNRPHLNLPNSITR